MKLKSISVLLYGKPLHQIYPHATRFQVWKYKIGRFIRKVLLAIAFLFALTGSYAFGAFMNQANETVITNQTIVNADAPVLDRIAKCESGDTQYGKNGQLLINVNKNGTVDLGRYQINSVWFSQATKLGYDLTKESDNKEFALWLYHNHGTQPWEASRPNCWGR